MTKQSPTYEGEVLSVLAFEFSWSKHNEAERKIKRRLRNKKLGAYDQTRIDTLRAFKDDVQQELEKYDQSTFYTGSHGYYAEMRDWDIPRLEQAMQARHPDVPESEIVSFLPYAILLYYLK
jgi:hypothetical protein